jgi:hypothetical protein
VILGQLVLQVQLELQDHKAHKVLKAIPEQLALKVYKAQQARQAQPELMLL